MNKTEFISAIAEKSGLTKADSKKAVDAFADVIVEALKSGDKVTLVGFGTFSVKESKEREGINPRTKEKITIAAKKSAKFKAGSEVDNALN
jgi:DNA-binding protein HU-beta